MDFSLKDIISLLSILITLIGVWIRLEKRMIKMEIEFKMMGQIIENKVSKKTEKIIERVTEIDLKLKMLDERVGKNEKRIALMSQVPAIFKELEDMK